MTTQTRPLTADDLWALPDDGKRHELIRGEVTTMPPAGEEHGFVGTEAIYRIRRYLEDHPVGYVFNADTGIVLGRDPDTVRAADAAFVRSDRLSFPLSTRYSEVVPDLVVEVVSPSDSSTAVEAKVQQWLEAGVHLVWVIHPPLRSVRVHVRGRGAVALTADQQLDGGDVLPGFSCRVADLFGPAGSVGPGMQP